MNVRAALARGWAAFCRGCGGFLRRADRAGGAHSWLGQVPWFSLGAFVLVAFAAWLRSQADWLTLIGFTASVWAFYFAGRNAEVAQALAQIKKAHQLAHEGASLYEEGRQLMHQALADARQMAMAYRHLHDRHFKMTGELVPFLADPLDDPKDHDA